MVTLYLGFHAAKMEPRPEDRKDAEIADGAGELGFFPPYSWWPLWCAAALGVIVFGVAVGAWWLVIIGVGARRAGAVAAGSSSTTAASTPTELSAGADDLRRAVVRPSARRSCDSAICGPPGYAGATTLPPGESCMSVSRAARDRRLVARPAAACRCDARRCWLRRRCRLPPATGRPRRPATRGGRRVRRRPPVAARRRWSRPTSARGATDVPVDTPVTVKAEHGTPAARSRSARQAGTVARRPVRRRDHLDRRRAARARHALHRAARRPTHDGKRVTRTTRFRTAGPDARPADLPLASRRCRARPWASACR